MISPAIGTPLPTAQATRSRVMAPRNRPRGTGPSARATAATGRSPKSAKRNATPQTTIPEKTIVNPTDGIASGSITPKAGVTTAAPNSHRNAWISVIRPGNRRVHTRSRSVGSRPSRNHPTRRWTAPRTQIVPTIVASATYTGTTTAVGTMNSPEGRVGPGRTKRISTAATATPTRLEPSSVRTSSTRTLMVRSRADSVPRPSSTEPSSGRRSRDRSSRTVTSCHLRAPK